MHSGREYVALIKRRELYESHHWPAGSLFFDLLMLDASPPPGQLSVLVPLRKLAHHQHHARRCEEESCINGSTIRDAGREPGRWQTIQQEEAEAEHSRASSGKGRQPVEQ